MGRGSLEGYVSSRSTGPNVVTVVEGAVRERTEEGPGFRFDVPYHQRYPNEVPRPCHSYVSTSLQISRCARRFLEAIGVVGRAMMRTESNGKVEDEAPSEHLRAVRTCNLRSCGIVSVRTPVIGLIGMVVVVFEFIGGL